MSNADDDNIGYSGAVDSYWQAGWRGILPLKHKHKGGKGSGLPSGCTGYGGVDPSYPDILQWSEIYRDGNLCLRMPDDVIGIDVDAYGAKTGAAAFVEATKRWGPLPRAPRSSSREGDLTSGIRLFKVPPGTMLQTAINFPDLGIGDIEIIQHHHRYLVAWPSIHPEDRPYRWRDEHDNPLPVPRVDELPDLPITWIEGLRVRPQTPLSDSAVLYDIRKSLTLGAPAPAVAERLRQAIKELNLPGSSRHDTCTRHVIALARLGKNGQPGVLSALETLMAVFKALRISDGSDSNEPPEEEFFRMLSNDNLARELAKPGNTEWVARIGILLALEGMKSGDDSGASPGEGNETPEAVTFNADQPSGSQILVDDSAPHSPLTEIERGFWDSRESLRMVWQTGMARLASPWAVLGICAARALAQVRPNATLPPVIGGPGSLNFFVALVAKSGGGKGAANSAADLLVPKAGFYSANLGSGEGMVKLFDRQKGEGGEMERRESVLINVDEVDTLVALNQRSASTTTTVLRSAFSGESLGFAYLNRAGAGDIEQHSYRMTLVVSVQPKQSGGLLAGEGGGLPQRFMWFPAGEKRLVDRDMWPSGPLNLPRPGEWLYPREIVIPAEARRLLRSERIKAAREEEDALDGHALYCREKFAFALAVMDGRTEMTLEDWELSGIAADISTYSRELCVDQLKAAARIDAIERGAIRGIEIESADAEKVEEQVKRSQRVMTWLLHKLDAAPDGFLTQSDLMLKISGRDRKTLGAILENGHLALRSELAGNTLRWYRA